MKTSDERLKIYKRDRTLAAKAKEGDDHSRNELVQLYLPLSKKLAYSFRQYVEDPEDLSQEALLRLTKRIKDYDGSKSEFITFAWGIMLYEIKDVVTSRRNRAKRLVSLYHAIGEDEGELIVLLEDKKSPKINNGVSEKAGEYLMRHLDALDKKDRVIIERVLAGKSREEISDEIAKSKQYVKERYDFALKVLRNSIDKSVERKGIEALLS